MKSTQIVLEDLTAARALIEDERDWCPRGWGDRRRRCAVRAIAVVTSPRGYPEESPRYRAALARMRPEVDNRLLSTFNDTHDHGEVIAAFDRAIEKLASS